LAILASLIESLEKIMDNATATSNTANRAQTLAGKVAFVQGGSRGIGAAIAIRLAQEGAAVALTYVSSEQPAHEVVRAIEGAGGRALALRADSADAAQLVQAIDTAATAFGRIDILVNNAGVAVIAPIDEFKLVDFDRIVAVNVRSVFVATQAAVKYMGEGGRVITIGSTNAERIPFAGGAAYAMSKAAIVGLTKGLARDLGPRGITVNNVQPGPVDTDMNPADTEFAASMRALMAIDRYGRSDEIASFVAYLAGPEAAYITGASLLIDGGFAA
jgi:3-oxoacyl-[acyl-carrier protein] reductase